MAAVTKPQMRNLQNHPTIMGIGNWNVVSTVNFVPVTHKSQHIYSQLTTYWYIAVLPADFSISRKAPGPFPSVARVTAIVVAALQLAKALQVEQVLVGVGRVPRLTRDTILRLIDGAFVSSACTTVAVT